MGHLIHSLAKIPVDTSVDFYIFMVGKVLWEGGAQQLVSKNFKLLAKEIGEDSFIVEGLTEHFADEVCIKYLGKEHKKLKNLMPALLITDSHPENLTDKSLRLIVPTRTMSENYQIVDEFFSSLSEFIRGESSEFIDLLEDASSNFKFINEVFVLQPNIMGVGVNINDIAIKLRKWYKKKRKKKKST